jgi:hypothetical protein
LKYQSAEDALEATGFGLSRSDVDFLEVSCSGLDSIAFHSDRLSYDSSFARLFAGDRHYWITVDRASAAEVVRDYFRLERNDFEATYRRYLAR